MAAPLAYPEQGAGQRAHAGTYGRALLRLGHIGTAGRHHGGEGGHEQGLPLELFC